LDNIEKVELEASRIHSIDLGTDLVDSAGPYKCLFDQFNRVQSTLIINGLPTKNCNLVLGTSTSTGKTISAELFVHSVLAQGRRVLYVAPMKALVTEKLMEWTRGFPNHQVEILTGDFRKATNGASKLSSADIVVMTTEMLDSQSRAAHRSPDHWMDNVGLIVMDEGHIIGSPSRGVPGEVGILRVCSLFPEDPPRVVILSATLPNAPDFANWLSKLNGLDTYTLNDPWRPIKLSWEFYPIKARQYAQSRKEMIWGAVNMAKKKPNEKFMIFAHEKKTGHNLKAALEKAGIPTEFHRADLPTAKRMSIESRFKDKKGDLRVIIATSTLAWGVNLPAKNVVILGVTRGITKVDLADIIQMSGRSGRLGIDTTGTCILMCPSDKVSRWSHKVQNSPAVKSALLDEKHLRFQILAEIDLGILTHPDDLPGWFDRTLVGQQVEYPEDHFENALDKLLKMGMLTIEDELLKVTRLGRVGTSLYFTPDDIYHWYKFMKANDGLKTDTQIAGLIGGSPTLIMNYVPAEFKDTVSLYLRACGTEGTKHRLAHPFMAYALWMHIKGEAGSNYGLRFYLNNITQDADRLTNAISMIGKITGIEVPSDLALRIRHGVPRQLAFLCDLPGVGPQKAHLLYLAGVTTPEKLQDTKLSVLINCLGQAAGKKVYECIQEAKGA